jgi:hypothetical protein
VSAAVSPLVKNDILKADRTQEEGHLIFRRIVTAMHCEHLVAWIVGPGAVLAALSATYVQLKARLIAVRAFK